MLRTSRAQMADFKADRLSQRRGQLLVLKDTQSEWSSREGLADDPHPSPLQGLVW